MLSCCDNSLKSDRTILILLSCQPSLPNQITQMSVFGQVGLQSIYFYLLHWNVLFIKHRWTEYNTCTAGHLRRGKPNLLQTKYFHWEEDGFRRIKRILDGHFSEYRPQIPFYYSFFPAKQCPFSV